jgi:hypothetical protein
MHLYLGHSPRTLYLLTGSREERQGRPHKALIFRAAETNANQVVVEFLPGDEVNLSSAVRLTSRIVKGCLGLISIENGAYTHPSSRYCIHSYPGARYLPCSRHFCDWNRRHPPFPIDSGECS